MPSPCPESIFALQATRRTLALAADGFREPGIAVGQLVPTRSISPDRVAQALLLAWASSQRGARIRAVARSDFGWRTITATRPGRCDLCGKQFGRGARIRYEPATHRVRCLGKCQTLPTNFEPAAPPETKPKRIRARPMWQGEYVSLYDRGDYVWRKCASCGRNFESAAGRVAQAKKRGICPACEKKLDPDEIERVKERRLAQDREQWRRSKGMSGKDGPQQAGSPTAAAADGANVGRWYALTLAEDCERCGARAGEPCLGKKAGSFHLPRYEHARQHAGKPIRRRTDEP